MYSVCNIFNTFCKYVDERIFSEENAGTDIAFVIDQSFIDDFCKIYSIDECLLMTAVRNSLYSNRRDHLYVKGILAIQLFAATKRANEEGISERNYRERLSQVLDWDMNDLQDWMKQYQEDMWDSLYSWCDQYGFLITKCERKNNTGKYVQYPVTHARLIFTDEDLLYIARCFIGKNLLPEEDIQKDDFRRLIGNDDIKQNIQTNHARLVVKNSLSSEDYYNQVYNYFLRWNGKYKERSGNSLNVKRQLYVYLPNDYSCIELRDSQLSLYKKFDLTTTSYEVLAKNYRFKRNGVILFKHDDLYEDYWQEVRFLEGEEEEGLVVCYYQKAPDIYFLLRSFMVYENKYVRIFKIKNGFITREFYSHKRFYELYGGLKINRQAYLLGAAPILRLEMPARVWIDGKACGDGKCEGNISLNHLSEGHHYIKIQDCMKLEIDLLSATANTCTWMNSYAQWEFDKRNTLWISHKTDHGIVGLDFSSIPQKCGNTEASTLKRWSELLTFGQFYENENNITLQIIKQTAP